MVAKTKNTPPQGATLIDRFLQEQQQLTAVDRFSSWHEQEDTPAQAKHYKALLPAEPPKEGQQYAFDVDLDACSGCKSCVTACHNQNGLDDGEAWRDVGVLVGGSTALPVIQHVTSACHHCIEPACLEGCPVLAYDKDPVTGIVKHLDDQCIGCQYCVFKCPYDVPKYNKQLGIVRKCDMCSDRLAADEAPACVAACPNEAIRITVVDQAQVVEDCETNTFLPGAPDPDYTLPTTNYHTDRVMPRNLLPADRHSTVTNEPHLPLVAMLVLTQLSVGVFLIDWLAVNVLRLSGDALSRPSHVIVAFVLGMTALAASTLHLGRPLYAFRAIVGLRTSWLSREILAFGVFAGLVSVYAASRAWLQGSAAFVEGLSAAVVIAGVVGVFCSVMIYHDTRRPFWRFGPTAVKFTLTALVLGLATVLVAHLIDSMVYGDAGMSSALRDWGRFLCLSLAGCSVAKLVVEFGILVHLKDRKLTAQRRSAGLLVGPLSRVTLVRVAVGLFGGVVLPLLLAADAVNDVSHGAMRFAAPAVVAIFCLTLLGELLERYSFFAAVVAPRMPGGHA